MTPEELIPLIDMAFSRENKFHFGLAQYERFAAAIEAATIERCITVVRSELGLDGVADALRRFLAKKEGT